MLKRISILILAMLIIFSCACPGALAAGADNTGLNKAESKIAIPQPIELPYGPPAQTRGVARSSSGAVDTYQLLFELETKVKNAVLNGESSVDLSSYMVYPADINLSYLAYFSPYFGNGIELTAYHFRGSYYSNIKINTSLTAAEAQSYFASVDAKVAQLRAEMDTGATDVDKILILHDYLCYNAAYDMSGSCPSVSYKSAGVLMKGVGVCNSYAYAAMYLLALCDIECWVTISEAMNHAWNIVKVDGNYYHMDITWDDKIPDKLGKVYHDHFLLSDGAIGQCRGISNQYHYGWDRTDLVCSSTIYDNAYWTESVSLIIMDGDNSYYVDSESIVKRNSQTSEISPIKDLGIWPVWGGSGHWVGTFSGITTIGRDIYYNTATQIRKINMDTLKDELVYSPDTTQGYIFGNDIKNGILRYLIKKDANEEGTILSVKLSDIIQVEPITLNKSELLLDEGESFTFEVSGNTDGLVWTTDNAAIIRVEPTGVVTAVGEGSARVIVTNGEGAQAYCEVTVFHTHVYTETVIEPDCLNPGHTECTCSCGMSYDKDIVDALGHEIVVVDAVDPSCEEPGSSEESYCSRCGEVFAEKEILSALGHAWDDGIVSKEPTETEDGERFFRCIRCDATKTEIIEKLGHVHTYSLKLTPATCEEQGYTTYACACGYSYISYYVDALGHNWGPWILIEAPTVYKEGVEIKECSLCGATEERSVEKLPSPEPDPEPSPEPSP
ncbi:MAG: Ig-like domain-containing protein, partial [Oscillospiraceae bacterium]|nr:Ig-like domain-containing protein [Oscillospiraceae bacterium]